MIMPSMLYIVLIWTHCATK